MAVALLEPDVLAALAQQIVVGAVAFYAGLLAWTAWQLWGGRER